MKTQFILRFFVSGLLLPLVFTASKSFARSFVLNECELQLKPQIAYTLPVLSQLAREDVKEARSTIFPERDFFDLDKAAATTRQGLPGPKALQEFTGKNWTYMPVPGVDATSDLAIGSPEIRDTLPVYINNIPWQGQMSGTLAYLTLPYAIRHDESDYLIGPQYEELNIYLPGGGTKHSRGENSTDLGVILAKRGIATMGLDMHGHGFGPAGSMQSMEQIMDWLMEVVNRTVHPNVKITITGHSWGAMLGIWLRNHSNNPKYARIKQVIALSPGIDASLGGDVKKKLEFERWFEENYHKFGHRMAQKDLAFLNNSLEDDKTSIDGVVATTSSHIDYRTPRQTLEEQEGLIDLHTMIGSADGLTYVGREHLFSEGLFGNLKEGSDFTVIGPGLTYASKDENDLIPTGHQVAYVQIPGSNKVLVFNQVADWILKDRATTTPEKKRDYPEKVFDNLVRQYAHYIPFRKMLEYYVAYSNSPTAYKEEASVRRDILVKYNEKVSALRKTLEGKREDGVKENLNRIKTEVLGIQEPLNLRLAREEYNYKPLTPERKQLLEKFLKDAEAVDEQMKSWKDEVFHQSVQDMWEKEKEFLEKLGAKKLEDYVDIYREYNHKKHQTMTNEEKKARQKLGNIDRDYKTLENKSRTRFGDERIRRLDSLIADRTVNPQSAKRELEADRSDERRRNLRKYIVTYSQNSYRAKKEYNAYIRSEINKIEKPPGIQSPEQSLEESQMLQAELNMQYVPNGHPEIEAVVKEAADIAIEVETLRKEGANSLNAQQSRLNKLQHSRQQIAKTWSTLWKEMDGTSTFALTSEAVESVRKQYAENLVVLKQTHQTLGVELDRYSYECYLKHGPIFTREDMQNRPISLRDAEKAFIAARHAFLKTKAELIALFEQEALQGNLSGARAKEARQLAHELSFADGTITTQIKELAQKIEDQRKHISLKEQRHNFLRWQYSQLMQKAGLRVAFNTEAIDLIKLLDEDRVKLMNYMKEDPALLLALDSVLVEWEHMAKRFRDEQKFLNLNDE